jgi:hypothetical protein
MAVKIISPQLQAYYEQLKHPMPDFLLDMNVHNIHDVGNMRYNERLWQHVKELSEKGHEPGIHEFRQMAAGIRKTVEAELYECEDPNRLSMDEIIYRITDAQVALSPLNLGDQVRSNTPQKSLVKDKQIDKKLLARSPIIVVTVAISTRGLSKLEFRWLEDCYAAYSPDTSGGDNSIAIGTTVEVDSVEGVDQWLPRRLKRQILRTARSKALEENLEFRVPLNFRFKSFLGKFF